MYTQQPILNHIHLNITYFWIFYKYILLCQYKYNIIMTANIVFFDIKIAT